MKTFEELKEDLLERAKKHNACQDGYRMGLNAKSKKDLLEAITSNWFWVFRTSKMIDANYLEDNFSEKELSEAGIYTRKEHASNTRAFACGSATVKACGSATVKACGSATVKACNNSYVEDCTGNINTVSDYGIVKDYYNHKIYIKKGKFEIIEIE